VTETGEGTGTEIRVVEQLCRLRIGAALLCALRRLTGGGRALRRRRAFQGETLAAHIILNTRHSDHPPHMVRQ